MANETTIVNGVTKRKKEGNFLYYFPTAQITAFVAENSYTVKHELDAGNLNKTLFDDITDKLGAADIEEYVDELANLGNYFEIEPLTSFLDPLIPEDNRSDVFSNLPAATTEANQYWVVDVKENNNEPGIYKSNGVTWIFVGVDASSIIPAEWVFIRSLDDFPTPVGGFIPLADDTYYQVFGAVDIGANGFDCDNHKVKLFGEYTAVNQIISTKTGDFIKGDGANLSVQNITLINNSCTDFFNIINGAGRRFTTESLICLGTGDIGVVDKYDTTIMRQTRFDNFTDGIMFTGAQSLCLIDGMQFVNVDGTLLDFNGATFDNIQIESVVAQLLATSTGIEIQVDGGNVNANGKGIIEKVRFDLSLGGTAILGYSPLDLAWQALGNEGIISSDRIIPTGWGRYDDDGTTPINLTTTPVLIPINGLGPNQNENFLPRTIRGTSNLFVSPGITPISEGDSYDVAVTFQVTAKGGGVSEIVLQIDEGVGATPTLVRFGADFGIAKTPPFAKVRSFLVTASAEMIANSGRLFMSTDTGTATISTRDIILSRNSSGAS